MTRGATFVTITRGRFRAGARDAAVDVMRRMVERDQTEPGTIVQAFHLDEADPDGFVAYEVWASEAGLADHRANQLDLREALAPLVDGSFEVVRCVPLFAKGVPFSA